MVFESMEEKKTCIIVYGEDEESYANLLFGLFGEFEEHECALWTEKQYQDSRGELSSSAEVIFIGNTKTTKKLIPNLKIKFNKFGMKYGWLGNQAVIFVDDFPKKKEEFNSFCNYSAKVYDQFEKYEGFIDKFNTKAKKAIFALPLLLGPISGVTSLSILYFFDKKKRRQITDQQYNVVVRNFFTNGLSEFMED
jgi:hypothetical protein